ncbi:hypothetical protein [Xanthomonas phaseoli]|uniref:hypothetical protein n=1 Tax=Xanthomonas phaseoli TaxID=1985254 RepID=UPI0002F43575|nr:hypothetical protein [Xanthomonas phaseoli]RWU12455.1 hypothetical protein XANMN_23335 [Xanthomonas phaseoli pv. manihotis str. CIO151]UEQ13643.1 hypothetical protein K9838_12985 [Xanthomonas phaseoli pv. manihotis]
MIAATECQQGAQMKDSNIRMVRFLELKLDHGTGAQHKQDWDLNAILVTANGEGFYQRGVREGAKKTVRIKHYTVIEVEGRRYAVLLFVQADSGFIDASYENMATGVSRTFNKDDGEGYRTEAHLVIDLECTKRGTMQVYPAVLEESPGLGPSTIWSRLQNPMHKAGQREMKDSSGEVVTWFPVVALDGLLSKSLIEEIAKGELLAFDLVTEQLESAGIDEPSELKRRRRTLHLDVVQHPDEGKVGHLISRARQIAFREDYEKVRISYKEHGTNRQKTAVLDVPEDAADPSEAIEKLVSRTAKIELQQPMNWDHDEVATDLAVVMVEKLTSEQT